MRIVVVGLYNSGTTCLAGALQILGADMGSPFWHDHENFYEPYDLSCVLRHFWNEPHCNRHTRQDIRVDFLRNWIIGREALGSSHCGAKHPLLCLSLADLQSAWGNETLFVWSYRELEESIVGLRKRGWFGDKTEFIQKKLWTTLHEFDFANVNTLKIEYSSVLQDPSREIDRIIDACGLPVNGDSRSKAIEWVRTPSVTKNAEIGQLAADESRSTAGTGAGHRSRV